MAFLDPIISLPISEADVTNLIAHLQAKADASLLSNYATTLALVVAKAEVAANTTAIAQKANASALNAHINDHNNPHATTAEQVGALPLSGGTMVGSIDLNGNNLSGVANLFTYFGGEWTPTHFQPNRQIDLLQYAITGNGWQIANGVFSGMAYGATYLQTQGGITIDDHIVGGNGGWSIDPSGNFSGTAASASFASTANSASTATIANTANFATNAQLAYGLSPTGNVGLNYHNLSNADQINAQHGNFATDVTTNTVRSSYLSLQPMPSAPSFFNGMIYTNGSQFFAYASDGWHTLAFA